MMIGRGDDDRQRDATGVDQQHPLAPISFPDPSGLARQIPAPVGPSPGPRRRFAIARRYPPCRRTQPTRLATASERIRPSPTPGSAGVLRSRSRTAPSAGPSTGNPYAAHRRSPRMPCATPSVCDPHRACADTSGGRLDPAAAGSAAPPAPKTHRTLPTRAAWLWTIDVSAARTEKRLNILSTDKLLARRPTHLWLRSL